MRKTVFGFLNVLFAVLCILSIPFVLPVVIPCAIIGNSIKTRKIRRLAESTSCTVCGKVLGTAACRLADETARQSRAEYLKQNPGVRLRIVKLVYAICTSCGTVYGFDKSDQELVVRGKPKVQIDQANAG